MQYWLGKNKPCLTYGLRGIAYYKLTVQGCEQDLHSGVLGGTVHEAMTDLVRLMASLVDSNGNILVDGVLDDVKPVTPEEEALYEPIEFDLEEYKKENKSLPRLLTKPPALLQACTYATLAAFSVRPSRIFLAWASVCGFLNFSTRFSSFASNE